MKELISPNQAAKALGVSEASLKRWCDKGLLPVIRTAGGHRRIPIHGVLQFIRQQGADLVKPEVLGLPPATGRSGHSLDRVCGLVRAALEAGDESQCERLVFNLYLSGHSTHQIFDRVIGEAFHQIGDRWSHGDVEVYEERRGVEVALRVLFHLRQALPGAPSSAPLAIGGTLSGDAYSLPTNMAEISLREAGWRAQNYGTNHPVATLCKAIEEVRPRLFWLSVSAFPSREQFLADYGMLQEAAAAHRVALAVGGRDLDASLREQMTYSAYCDTMGHLVSFAKTLVQHPDEQASAGD